MADFNFVSYKSVAPGTGHIVNVAGAAAVSCDPKIVCSYKPSGENAGLYSHLFWGFEEYVSTCTMMPGNKNIATVQSETVPALAASNVAQYSVDCYGVNFQLSSNLFYDAGCSFRYIGQSPVIVPGNYVMQSQPRVLVNSPCVSEFPAGSRFNQSVNWAIPEVHYFCGYTVTAGGSFTGNFTRGKNNYNEFLYIQDLPTLNVNDFPARCFDPSTPPPGISAADFFGSLIRSRSSSVFANAVSSQMDLSEKMAIAKLRTSVGDVKTFDVFIISFEPFNFNRRNCDAAQVTFEWRLLKTVEVVLTGVNNTGSTRFALVSFSNGWILSVNLFGTSFIGCSQEGAYISETGQVDKFTYQATQSDSAFFSTNPFVGIWPAPDFTLFYGTNEVSILSLGKSPEKFVNPFPPITTGSIGPTVPINGISLL